MVEIVLLYNLWRFCSYLYYLIVRYIVHPVNFEFCNEIYYCHSNLFCAWVSYLPNCQLFGCLVCCNANDNVINT